MVDIAQFLNGDPEGVWYNVPGAPKAEVRIKLIKPKRQRELTAQCTSRRIARSRVMPELDEDKYMRLLLDEAIVDWRGIEQDGAALPVSFETKRLLDENWPAFSNLWMSVLGVQNRLDEAYEEALQKNSSSGEGSISQPTTASE